MSPFNVGDVVVYRGKLMEVTGSTPSRRRGSKNKITLTSMKTGKVEHVSLDGDGSCCGLRAVEDDDYLQFLLDEVSVFVELDNYYLMLDERGLFLFQEDYVVRMSREDTLHMKTLLNNHVV